MDPGGMPGLLKPGADLGQIRKRYQRAAARRMEILLVKRFPPAALRRYMPVYTHVEYRRKVLSVRYNFSNSRRGFPWPRRSVFFVLPGESSSSVLRPSTILGFYTRSSLPLLFFPVFFVLLVAVIQQIIIYRSTVRNSVTSLQLRRPTGSLSDTTRTCARETSDAAKKFLF